VSARNSKVTHITDAPASHTKKQPPSHSNQRQNHTFFPLLPHQKTEPPASGTTTSDHLTAAYVASIMLVTLTAGGWCALPVFTFVSQALINLNLPDSSQEAHATPNSHAGQPLIALYGPEKEVLPRSQHKANSMAASKRHTNTPPRQHQAPALNQHTLSHPLTVSQGRPVELIANSFVVGPPSAPPSCSSH
jgi:hypothetical protein